jgi:hypothetical protein
LIFILILNWVDHKSSCLPSNPYHHHYILPLSKRSQAQREATGVLTTGAAGGFW